MRAVASTAATLLVTATALLANGCNRGSNGDADAVSQSIAEDRAAAANLGAAWGEQLDELPDWTGFWFLQDGFSFPGRAFTTLAPDPAGKEGGFSYGELPGTFFKGAPYKPEYQKLYDDRVRIAREQFKVFDTMGSCVIPHGMPRILGGGPGPTEFLITPEQTTIIWDYMNEMVRVYTELSPLVNTPVVLRLTSGLGYATLMAGSMPRLSENVSPAEHRGRVERPRKVPSRVSPVGPLRRVSLDVLRSLALRKAAGRYLATTVCEKKTPANEMRATRCFDAVVLGLRVLRLGRS